MGKREVQVETDRGNGVSGGPDRQSSVEAEGGQLSFERSTRTLDGTGMRVSIFQLYKQASGRHLQVSDSPSSSSSQSQ